jgi:dTDP-4-dehydrorhamnose reductase
MIQETYQDYEQFYPQINKKISRKFERTLVFGANGMLGTTLQSLVDLNYYKLTDKDVNTNIDFCDIRDFKKVTELVNEYNPDIVMNFAALVDLEYCEKEKDDCYLTNTIAASHQFNLCKERNIPYVFISTAGIFGNDKEFYTEEDQPYPLSAYGKSKYYTEQILLNQNYDKYYIFRAGWMMGGGPSVDKKFVNKIMKQIKSGIKELNVVDDKLGVPTYTKDFAFSIIKHIEEDLPYGLYNMVSSGEASRYDTAVAIKEFLNLHDVTINKVDSDYYKTEYYAPRPYSEKLINKKLNDLNRNYMRNWKVCLEEYLRNYYK